MKLALLILTFLLSGFNVYSHKLEVGEGKSFLKITSALDASNSGDTIYVYTGLYKEGNIVIDKSIVLIGINYPLIDGEKKVEIFSLKANDITVSGFKIQKSAHAALTDPCAIKIYNCTNVIIENNILDDNFFGIYLQNCKNCFVRNNNIKAYAVTEQENGNGIHCWRCDSLQIIGNKVSGHRDGIYFEFVTNSIIWRNVSKDNIRYGLHFMFSHDDAYITNVFKNNGAGVSVMFTHRVKMFNNTFIENWGDASYGLMIKEITDSYILGNKFVKNTSAIHMEGSNRIVIEKNVISENGWGIQIQSSCMDNEISFNNFISNTFDIATNGTLVLNSFNSNYWDKYEGYDINKDKIGDVPYHPLSVFSVIIEKNPPAMLLFRSFMVTLLDKSEKVIPSLTPDNFVDNKPLMHSLNL